MTTSIHHAPAQQSRIAGVGSLLGAIGCGALLAAQSRINGELKVRSSDAIFAAAVSFGVGLVLVAAVTLGRRSGRHGAREAWQAWRAGRPPRWLFAGGLLGSVTVLSQSLSVAVLGVALFTVAMVAGQVLGGLIVDRTGFAGVAHKALTGLRLAGAALVLTAALLAGIPQLRGGAPLLLLALPFVAGFLNSFQHAMNGRVRTLTRSAPTATTINFATGFAVLLLAFAIQLAITGQPPVWPRQWWLYAGGALGVLVIGASSVLVRHIGVLVLLMATIAGQVLASLVLDGLFFHRPLPASTLTGAGLALVGVLIAAASGRVNRPG